MKQAETLAQTIVRTCVRYAKIQHLPLDQKKHLMALSEEDFNLEFKNIGIKKAS